MSLSRNKSASALPDFGHNNSFGDVHVLRISLHQSKSIPFIANTNIVSHPESYNYVGNHTHEQSFSAWGPQIQDTGLYTSTTTATALTRETHPLVPVAVESPNYMPLAVPRGEDPSLFGELPPEGTAEPEASAQSDTSQNRPTEDKDEDEDEGDWLDMADSDQSSRSRCVVVAGSDSCGLIEISDDQDLEYRPYRGSDFFFPGRLIGVYSDTDSSISDRTMIVLAVSGHGFIQCLALCRHEGHTGEERDSFYKAHAAVYRDNTSPPPTATHATMVNAPIEISLKRSRHNLKDSCYINFEHTWTLQEHVPVVDLGYVRKSQRKYLLVTHEKVQNELRQRTMATFKMA
ncbi:hypothetical protein N431DRAFT_436668 [Stipitochalara longipes BDJ]|nr:hypothetical protein N431DRAFT_436668 [Stipitochalara longipes BDJ]